MASLDMLIAEWKQERASLARQLQMLENGTMHTGTSILGSTTNETIARVKSWIKNLDELLAEYSKPGRDT
jgi:polysaccharide deacetylase 2 family uncharacterized protein YibQ